MSSRMGRPPKEALRALTDIERSELEALARSRSAPADRIARAQELLAVAEEASFTRAAEQAHRRSGDAVARLVSRFNKEGMLSVFGHHGGGPAIEYGIEQQARILQEFARVPEREEDGTATWSLSTLQRVLRKADDGLAHISTYVILQTLHRAGYTWQENRTWCQTGTVERKRKEGTVEVTDPHTDEKRGSSSRRTP
jgi:hypothetical protein